MAKENQIELGKKLLKIRKLSGHTLEQVAGRLGVTKSYLSKIENGHQAIPDRLLQKFAELYSSSYALIFGQTVNLRTNEGYKMEHRETQVQVNIDPVRTPVLYSDWQNVSTNDGGVVINFGQSAAPAPDQHVVARIGLSHAQAKELHRVLQENLQNYYKSKNMEF